MDQHTLQECLEEIYQYEREYAERRSARDVTPGARAGADDWIDDLEAGLHAARAKWLALALEERALGEHIERLTPELAQFVHHVLLGGRPWRGKGDTCRKARRRRRRRAKRKST